MVTGQWPELACGGARARSLFISMTSPEQLGSWGSGTHRADAVLLDGVVHKTAGPWTPAVFALLRHLEAVGFPGAQRVVGDGYGFVPGGSAHPHAWSDDAVAGVGVLLRGLHDATATFTPPDGAVWQPNWLRDLGGEDIVIGHCDPGPWNIVGRHGQPDAFVDWEFAGPVDRLWELAETVWLNAHLVDRLSDVAVHNARHEAVSGGVTIESTAAVADNGYPVLWAVTWRARSASWIARNRTVIRRAVCG
jgi:hypothetical protein